MTSLTLVISLFVKLSMRFPMPANLEKRVTALERELSDLKSRVQELSPAKLTPEKDWRSTIGMFAGDEIMKQIDEEGRRIREKDRARARRRAIKRRKRVKT